MVSSTFPIFCSICVHRVSNKNDTHTNKCVEIDAQVTSSLPAVTPPLSTTYARRRVNPRLTAPVHPFLHYARVERQQPCVHRVVRAPRSLDQMKRTLVGCVQCTGLHLLVRSASILARLFQERPCRAVSRTSHRLGSGSESHGTKFLTEVSHCTSIWNVYGRGLEQRM